LGLAERERKQSQTFYTLGIRAPNLRPMLQEPISFIPSGRVAQAPDGPPRGHSRVRAFPLAGIPACGHSRSRRAFMRSAQVSETCFGGDTWLLDGRVPRWLPPPMVVGTAALRGSLPGG
jgi:hypothetical protein